MARAGGEESEMNTATGQKTPLPRAASTVHFDLFDEGDVLAARPTPLVEVRPQQGVLRHTVECIADVVPMVQILDVPVPQSGEQVVEVLQKIDAPLLPEQVINVPKISQDLALLRLGDRLRQPQTAEQLMEVPTIVSYSSLLEQTAEQTDDNPVPGRGEGGGARGGLQGSRVRQNSAALVEQIADIPARRGLPGSPRPYRAAYSGANSRAEDRFLRQNPAADVGQIADIPARRGLSGFLPGQGSSASSSSLHDVADAGIQGVFRTFPRLKKSAGLGPHSGSELGADFTPWTRAAYAESMAIDDDESEAESESEAEVEDGAATRFAAGFRPLRVCMRFLEHQMGRPVWGCAYGDRCTFAHSWAELHPEASAHERELASYFPD